MASHETFELLVLTRYLPGECMDRHAHSLDGVSFFLQGSVLEKTSRGAHFGGAGEIVVKPAGFEHSNVVGSEGLTALSFSSKALSEGYCPAFAECWRQAASDYAWIPIFPSVSRLVSLWRRRLVQAGELIEEFMFGLSAEMRFRSPNGIGPDDWCRKATQIMRDSLSSPIRLTELAETVGVHPVTLSHGLRTRFGKTKSEIEHQMRLMAALPRVNRGEGLGQIAHDLGYCDQAHFSRSFKHWLGVSPADFRLHFLQNR